MSPFSFFSRLQAAVARRRPISFHGSKDRVVLLAGTTRGGTTWVARLLNADNRFRYLFEPFHARVVPEVGSFAYRQYLRPDDPAPAHRDVTDLILSGRVRHPWVDQRNHRVVARQLLVKDVRVNLMLGWLARTYPDMRIVLLLRHPGAVAHSRLQLGWDDHLAEVLSQPELVRDHIGDELRTRILEERSAFVRHVYLWGIETAVPIRQLEPGRAHVLRYERVVDDPHASLDSLADYLGWRPPVQDKQLTTPSIVSRVEGATRAGADPRRDWTLHVEDDERQRGAEALDHLDLGDLYDW